jgi:hypothetical protein
MKLALETGAVLVPIYVFGANDFHSQREREELARWRPPRTYSERRNEEFPVLPEADLLSFGVNMGLPYHSK